jgi:hypothetical protein
MILKNIEDFIEKLSEIEFDCEQLISELDGKAERPLISKSYKKVVIRIPSSKINTIILECHDHKIKAISLNGDIDVTFRDIKEKYKKIEENYSAHDDMYFYSFKMIHNRKSYQISFFEPSNQKIDFYSDTNLSNLNIFRELL